MTTIAPTAPQKTGYAAILAAGIVALVAGATYLLKTNPHSGSWLQEYDPTGHWWLSTLLAAMPVVVLLCAMAIFRLKAHIAAVIGLLTALTVAIAVYHMPVRLALTTTAYGAGYGLFPICWIILPVIFLYQLTVRTGRFTALQESLTNITDDGRLQLRRGQSAGGQVANQRQRNLSVRPYRKHPRQLRLVPHVNGQHIAFADHIIVAIDLRRLHRGGRGSLLRRCGFHLVAGPRRCRQRKRAQHH